MPTLARPAPLDPDGEMKSYVPAQYADERALLVVGHGTRQAGGVAEFLDLIDRLRAALPRLRIEPGFLELAEPTIGASIEKLAGAGVRHITLAPLLLLAAGHVKRDIPEAAARAASAWPGLRIDHADYLGCHPNLVELSVLRGSQAFAARGIQHGADTVLLMVGRGSNDATANAEMYQFSRLRWEKSPLAWLEVAFAAMARPTLDESLHVVARLPFTTVLVQPHLLFSGELLSRIRDTVDQFAARHRNKEWIVADPLGVHELLIRVLLARCGLLSDDWPVMCGPRTP